MQAVISARNDGAAVLNQCSYLEPACTCTAAASSQHAPEGSEKAMTDGAALVPSGTKRAFVLRLTICDGPLACHAIQGCLYRYVCACAAAVSDGDSSQGRELEEWLVTILGTIMECLNRKSGGKRIDAKRLRSAMFLLQLLSTILKSDRGASHPERSNQPSVIEVGEPPSASSKATLAPNHQTRSGWESVAAQVCADKSEMYLEKMVREATTLVLGHQNADTNSAGFWVLSLVSDVLKGLRKRERSRGDPRPPSGCKRKHCGEARGPKVAPTLLSGTTAVAEMDGIDNGDDDGSPGLVMSGQLDVSGVAEAIAAFPVGGGSGATDVALKWLEVTQLLMEIAETRRQSLLGGILLSVPPTLWEIARQKGTRSLLLQEGPSRPPGAAFVEPGGADGALAQAMLTLIFRMLRVRGAQGSRQAPEHPHTERSDGNARRTEWRSGGGKGYEKESPATRPWASAAEALVATVTASAEDVEGSEGSSFGFAGRMVRLFSDQDDALVDMLLTNLYIFHDTRTTDQPEAARGNDSSALSPALRNLYHSVLHPGVLFAALLSEVRFDSGVFLDWLISPETNFLRYLTMLLRFAVAEWPEFATRVSCARIVTVEARARTSSLMKDFEEEEEKEGEEELVLSGEEADRLGKSVSCLSGLVTSARTLEKNGLVPYNLAPLLRRIDQVVSLYEDCGDAEERD